MQDITLLGIEYLNVPSIEIPTVSGGNASFVDTSDTTAVAGDVASGKKFYNASGVLTTGTNSGGGSSSGTDTSDATLNSGSQMLSGVTAYANGTKYTGTIVSRSSSDLTASGATITVPTGNYAEQATKSVASGSASTPATTISVTPSISVSSGGLITASASGSQSITPSVTAGYVSSGTAGTVSVSGSNTEQLTTKGATTYTPGTSDQTISSGTYLTGTQTISGDSNLVATNIKNGVSIFGVTGTYSGASGWTKVAETSYQISTTGTSATTHATWETGNSNLWTKANWIYVRIRDTEGKRNGYFYGSDQFFYNTNLANGGTATNITSSIRIYTRYNNDQYTTTATSATTGYGVWADTLYTDGRIRIRKRYNSTSSLTVNSTYKVEAYVLTSAGGVSIYE